MRLRHLGNTGIRVGAIGLGCGPMSRGNGPLDDDESIKTLHRALDLGGNFLDTAEDYGKDSHNETLIGKALKGRRDEAVICSKFGVYKSPDGERTFDGRPENARRACEASLKRLAVDCIDLYYLHWLDPQVPLEDSIGAIARLVDEGKVKAVGISNATADELRRAHATHPIAALQSPYSLLHRQAEAELLPTCRALGISFVAYHPLDSGAVGGTFYPSRGERKGVPGARDKAQRHREMTEARLKPLIDMAAKKGIPASQVALAWLLAKDELILPIPGTRRRRWLEENAAAEGVYLTSEELATLNAAYAPQPAAQSMAGERVSRK